jgi:hypothetical protein
LGAPFLGTILGAHQGFDCNAPSLISPPNGGFGAGNCFPLMVVVAPGLPGAPVVCWAFATDMFSKIISVSNTAENRGLLFFMLVKLGGNIPLS